MTASAIAKRLHGQPAGKRWSCRCPVSRMHKHGDRTRSLSVWESKDGWVCFRCFAGCTRAEILAAMGLQVRDLALNEMPSRKALADMERVRLKEERESAQRQRRWLRTLQQAHYWRERRDELGKMLFAEPESDKIAALFHRACNRANTLADSELDAFAMVMPKTFKRQDVIRVADMSGCGELPELILVELIFWSFYKVWGAREWLAAGKPWPDSSKAHMDPAWVMQRSVEIAKLLPEEI